ncbi:hypothetical protein EYF80_023179 [Liparis tanakae]|uniref:Uncharacterized protein n=1 Tax=Liparis tanakae TaxID=230148 RepID=A0A4Z2HMX9_9TELE|nr:hypothetical protein EYF80_023179 [Liparis tanakae]
MSRGSMGKMGRSEKEFELLRLLGRNRCSSQPPNFSGTKPYGLEMGSAKSCEAERPGPVGSTSRDLFFPPGL